MSNLELYIKKISTFTVEQLHDNMNQLHEDYDQNLEMDGSGELGGTIWKGFQPYFEALEKEFEKRGINPHQPEEDFEESVYTRIF